MAQIRITPIEAPGILAALGFARAVSTAAIRFGVETHALLEPA
jgi:hypothetical protein